MSMNIHFVKSDHILDCDKLLEGRTYTFISKHLGCTIDVYYGLINPGTRIISHAILIPDVVGVQQFYLKKVPGTTDSYNMINVHSALVMDMSGNASKLEYPICNSLYQQFSFVPSKSGTCSIYANTKQNGKLAVSNVLTVSCNGFNSLILTTAENSSDQEWSITEVQPPGENIILLLSNDFMVRVTFFRKLGSYILPMW